MTPADGERRHNWNRLSPFFAEHSKKIAGIVLLAVLTAGWTVFWNGLVVPGKVEALQLQRKADSAEVRKIRAVVDSLADVVFWQGGLKCGELSRDRNPAAWDASLAQCGKIASRTGAVFPVPTTPTGAPR